MLAHLGAFEVLLLVLVVGFISALFGVAGGVGASWALHARMHLLEDRVGGLMTLTNRFKGIGGQAVLQEQKGRLSKREQEAEALAAQLLQQPRARARGGLREIIAAERLPSDAEFAAEVSSK